MTQKEIKQTARLTEEGKRDLKEWLEKHTDEVMKKHGFTKIEAPTPHKNEQVKSPVSGTITFLKGNSAKKAADLLGKPEGQNHL